MGANMQFYVSEAVNGFVLILLLKKYILWDSNKTYHLAQTNHTFSPGIELNLSWDKEILKVWIIL